MVEVLESYLKEHWSCDRLLFPSPHLFSTFHSSFPGGPTNFVLHFYKYRVSFKINSRAMFCSKSFIFFVFLVVIFVNSSAAEALESRNIVAGEKHSRMHGVKRSVHSRNSKDQAKVEMVVRRDDASSSTAHSHSHTSTHKHGTKT